MPGASHSVNTSLGAGSRRISDLALTLPEALPGPGCSSGILLAPGHSWTESPGNLFLARGKEDQCSESMRVGGEAPGRYVEKWFQDPSG